MQNLSLVTKELIIQCVKMQYKKEIVHKLIQYFDNKTGFFVNILEAITYLRNAWVSVAARTVKIVFNTWCLHKK